MLVISYIIYEVMHAKTFQNQMRCQGRRNHNYQCEWTCLPNGHQWFARQLNWKKTPVHLRRYWKTRKGDSDAMIVMTQKNITNAMFKSPRKG